MFQIVSRSACNGFLINRLSLSIKGSKFAVQLSPSFLPSRFISTGNLNYSNQTGNENIRSPSSKVEFKRSKRSKRIEYDEENDYVDVEDDAELKEGQKNECKSENHVTAKQASPVRTVDRIKSDPKYLTTSKQRSLELAGEEDYVENGEKITKVLAHRGIGSRRVADSLVSSGRVTVNGKIAYKVQRISPDAEIKVDGKLVVADLEPRIYLWYKPKGVEVTHVQSHERPTLKDYLEKWEMESYKAIGRLDVDSEGLLLLTNNSTFKTYMERPQSNITRIYKVRIFGEFGNEQIERLKRGIMIGDFVYKPIKVKLLKEEKERSSIEGEGNESESRKPTNKWAIFELQEGKNREIRTILNFLGCAVSRIIRIGFLPYMLPPTLQHGHIQEGQFDSAILRKAYSFSQSKKASTNEKSGLHEDIDIEENEEHIENQGYGKKGTKSTDNPRSNRNPESFSQRMSSMQIENQRQGFRKQPRISSFNRYNGKAQDGGFSRNHRNKEDLNSIKLSPRSSREGRQVYQNNDIEYDNRHHGKYNRHDRSNQSDRRSYERRNYDKQSERFQERAFGRDRPRSSSYSSSYEIKSYRAGRPDKRSAGGPKRSNSRQNGMQND